MVLSQILEPSSGTHNELACLPATQALRPGLGRDCAFLGPRNALPQPRLLENGGGDGNPRGTSAPSFTLWVNHLQRAATGDPISNRSGGRSGHLASHAAKDMEEEYHNCVINSPMFADFLV